jgi:hypothetical protein
MAKLQTAAHIERDQLLERISTACAQDLWVLQKPVSNEFLGCLKEYGNLILKLMFLSLHETNLPINTDKLHSWAWQPSAAGASGARSH